MPNRCEFGCVLKETPMHRFPCYQKFPERFKTWVALVGGKLESESDWESYRKKFVCDRHFVDKDRTRSKRLNALAVPTLHITAGLPSSSNLQQFPNTALNIPTTSQLANTGENMTIQSFLDAPVASTQLSVTAMSQSLNIETLSKSDAGCHVGLEHNYTVISKATNLSKKDAFSRKVTHQTVQPLQTKINYLRSEISRLRKKVQSFQARLASAENISETMAFQTVMKNLKKPTQLFLHMQKQASKTPKGRRFTTEEKILSLSLYKKSPKSYALLQRYFTLPSAKAMKRLLSAIKLSDGINPVIFNKLKETVSGLDVADRLCTIIFDEMSITPQIFYDSSKDVLKGFTTNQDAFADHVLVFMIKGVKRNFKQPVAYYFTSGLKRQDLKNYIKTVVKNIQDAGLIIISTVCDQSATNVSTITELVNETKSQFLRLEKEWRHDVIRLNGQNIIPIYDVPHLIKGIRNNILKKNMIYVIKNEEKVVKWEHYQNLYAADKSHGELRLLHKLTEEHINPDKINKMRVKTATQIFSHSVAVATEHLTARGDLTEECRALIPITLLLDKLFDSLNVNSFNIPNGKMYKGPVKRHSPHHQLWLDAKEILKSIKFRAIKINQNKVRVTETSVPSVLNFIKTINGMEAIFKLLTQKYGFHVLMTRNFNQDPVENFFGNIRSYGARNNVPNTVAFEGAFKALLLNNYSTPQSSRANCEEDQGKCLRTLEFFLTEKPSVTGGSLEEESFSEHEICYNEEVFTPISKNINDAGQQSYVCGWVLTKCLRNITKSCHECRNQLTDTGDKNKSNSFIKAKEYSNKKWLCYPSQKLQNCFNELQMVIINTLKRNVPKKNIKKNIIAVAELLIDFPFDCSKHKENLKGYFLSISVNVIVHSWCRSVNRILSGKIVYNDGEDESKMAAQKYCNKHKHNKNKK